MPPIGRRRVSGGAVVGFADEEHRNRFWILAAGVGGCIICKVYKRVVFLYPFQVFLVWTYDWSGW